MISLTALSLLAMPQQPSMQVRPLAPNATEQQGKAAKRERGPSNVLRPPLL